MDAGQLPGTTTGDVPEGDTQEGSRERGAKGLESKIKSDRAGNTKQRSEGSNVERISTARSWDNLEADVRQDVQRDTGERKELKPEDKNHVINPDDVLVPRGDVKFNIMSETKLQYGKKTKSKILREATINILLEKIERIKTLEVETEDEEIKEIIRKFNYDVADLKGLTIINLDALL